ncbi:MAG: TetR/AcrR family transcriptional regulator [Chthoniobacteraceae bacterium]
MPTDSPAIAADPARERIVSAARVHYFAAGFRGVTMDDLAAELGMSKKTLYAHFPSKNALLEAVLENKFGEVNADMEEVVRRYRGDFAATLHEMLAVMLRHIDEVHAPFLRDMRRAGPEVFALVDSRRSALFGRYFDYLIREGRKSGLVRKDVPVHFIVEMVISAVRSLVTPAKLAELKMTPKAALSSIVTVILDGVLVHPAPTPRPPHEA